MNAGEPPAFLLLAFGPFGAWERNSTEIVSERAAERLRAGGARVVRRVLRAAVGALEESLEAAFLEAGRPAAVLACGLSGRARKVQVERVALNCADFRIPDVDGAQPRGLPLRPGEPDAWMTRSDVHAAVAAIEARGVAAQVSNSAGTFLCNATYFGVLRRSVPAQIPALFLHLPPLPGEAAAAVARGAAAGDPDPADPDAAMPLEQQVAAVEAAALLLLGHLS